jgi:hypothetical protein
VNLAVVRAVCVFVYHSLFIEFGLSFNRDTSKPSINDKELVLVTESTPFTLQIHIHVPNQLVWPLSISRVLKEAVRRS